MGEEPVKINLVLPPRCCSNNQHSNFVQPTLFVLAIQPVLLLLLVCFDFT